MAGLRTIKIRFLGDVKGLQQSAAKGAGALTKMSDKVTSTVKSFAAFAVGGLAIDKATDFLKDSVTAASDLNETVSKAGVIFGKNAKSMDRWAASAAKTMGLSTNDALTYASSLGDMFRQIGFTGNAASTNSKKVVQLASDLGSFNNLPTADVLDSISGAFRGEYDSLQQIIPNISAARVQQVALAQTGKKSASSLTAQEKATATLAIITKDGARAQGDFKRTSKGAANQQKILSAEVENQKAKIGKLLLPIYQKLQKFMISSVIPAITKVVKWLTQNKDTIQSWGSKALKIIVPLVAAFTAYKAVVTVISVATKAWAIATKIWAGVTKIAAAAQWILNAAMDANPIGLIVLAILALIAIIIVLIKYHKQIGAFFVAVWGKIWGFLKAVGAWFAGPFAGFFVKVWHSITGGVTAVWQWIVAKFNAVISFIAGVPGRVWAWLKTLWTNEKRGATILKDWIVAKWNAVIGWIKGVPGKIWKWLSGLWNNEKRGATVIKDWIVSKFNQVVSFVKGLPHKISKAAGGMWNGIKSSFRSAINGVIGWWNGLSLTLPSVKVAGHKIGGFTLSTPDVPYLAKGGAIARGGMAVVGEQGPELVSLPTGAQVHPNGAAPQPIEVRVFIGDQELRGMVRTEVREVNRGTKLGALARGRRVGALS